MCADVPATFSNACSSLYAELNKYSWCVLCVSGPVPHSGFLTAYRRLLQEVSHLDLPDFIRLHSTERQTVLGIDDMPLPPLRSPSKASERTAAFFHDVKSSFAPNVKSSPLLRAAVKADRMPDPSELVSPDFARSLLFFVTPAKVLSVRFREDPDTASASSSSSSDLSLTPQALLELLALFDFFERDVACAELTAVAVCLPQNGFAADADENHKGDSRDTERSNVLMALLQMVLQRINIPTYVFLFFCLCFYMQYLLAPSPLDHRCCYAQLI